MTALQNSSHHSYLSFSFYLCTSVDKCCKLLNVQHKEQVSVHHIIIPSITVTSFFQLVLLTPQVLSLRFPPGIQLIFEHCLKCVFKIHTYIPHTACFLSDWVFIQSRMFLLLLLIFKFFFILQDLAHSQSPSCFSSYSSISSFF